MRDLPEGWFEVALGDVVEPKQTRNPSNDGSETFRYIDVKAVDNTRNRVAAVPEVESRSAPSRARRLVREGDVLFSLVRPYLRNIAVVPADLDGQVASTAFSVLRPNGAVASRFLLHQVLQVSFVDSVPTFGNSPPSAREEDFLSQRIVVAPVREQHRIVAGIEVLFAKLDEAIAALRRTQANLGRYRASVLKAAVEGRLTARWRSENPPEESGEQLLERILAERRKRWEEDRLAEFAAKGRKPPKDWKSKYKEPVAPDASGLPELPEGWCWATVDQVARIASGQTPKGAAKLAKPSGPIPWYRVGDMTLPGNGRRLRRSRTYFFHDQVGRLGFKVLPPGSLVFPKRGGAIATNKKRELTSSSCVDLNIMALIPPAVLRSWIWLWFQTVNLASIGDGSNVPQINNHDILPLALPLPPVAEQKTIGDRLKVYMDTSDESLDQVTKIRERSASLRQSILKRAFEGRLVPQDPDDEPAAVLLGRIRAKRKADRR